MRKKNAIRLNLEGRRTLVRMLSLCLSLLAPLHSDADETAADSPVPYMIVVTGEELLTGIYADGHTLFITRTLRPLGLQCVGSMSVDDRPDEIRQALEYATARVPLVLVTGGLGPTSGDVTRDVLSDYTGIPLREHPDVLRQMERRFGLAESQLRANLRRQTRVPTTGGYLPNAAGTAVGLVFEMEQKVIVALPGPPRELQPMVREELIPYLSRRFGTHQLGCAMTVRFVGVGQSQIDQTLQDQVDLLPAIHVTSQFEGGRVDYTFSLPHDTPQDRAQLEQLKSEILRHMGDAIYATDGQTLEEHVLRQLARRGQTLTVVEVATGGLLVPALPSAPSAPTTVPVALLAPTTQQLSRLLRIAAASGNDGTAREADRQQLARAAVESSGSDWALVIGPPTRRDTGRWDLPVLLRQPDGSFEQFSLETDEPLDRPRLTTQLLDHLRRRWRGHNASGE
jgi:nicotinamide-nucleotide amidase